MKKKWKPILLFLAVILIVAAAIPVYLHFSPEVDFGVGKPVEADTQRYHEMVMPGFNSRFGTEPESLGKALKEFSVYNEKIVREIVYDLKGPMHITATVTKKGGVVTVVYSGPATTKDGESIQYYQEFSVDFGILTKIKLPED